MRRGSQPVAVLNVSLVPALCGQRYGCRYAGGDANKTGHPKSQSRTIWILGLCPGPYVVKNQRNIADDLGLGGDVQKKNKKQPTKATKQEIAFSENGLSQARFYFRPF